jgi:ATP-binding cassette subfamily B protein
LIVVAYRLSTIRLADRVLYLEDGRIRATGSHEELMAEAGYAAMIRAYERRERRATAHASSDGATAER